MKLARLIGALMLPILLAGCFLTTHQWMSARMEVSPLRIREK
jgi:hypothetical protein